MLRPMLKAIIFDFDGVLADSESLHFRGFQAILEEEDIGLSEEEYAKHYMGLTDAECFRSVFKTHERPLESAALRNLIECKSARMKEAIRAHDVLIPGMAQFVRTVSRTYRLAVASGALRAEIVLALQRADLLDAFEVIATAEDVRVGKPDPALYLHHCLV